MASAAIQILMQQVRGPAAVEPEEGEEEHPAGEHAGEAPGSPASPSPSAVRPEPPRTLGSLRLDPALLGMTPEEMNARTALIISKQRLVERMVLEQAMMQQIPRCGVFLVQFLLLMVMLWTAYPAANILSVHQALDDALVLKFDTDDTRPEDVHSIDDLHRYLQLLGPAWQEFSPGSSVYVTDSLAKTYLDQVTEFPPQQILPPNLEPAIGPSFTIAAWIKTSMRYDTLINKVQMGRNLAICWQFDLERLLYGQHETKEPVQIVHPLATSIYKAGVSRDDAWKMSPIRGNISDGNWHHYAVLVGPTQVTFVLDGKIQGSVDLPRPVTDCEGGMMGVGSDIATGSIVGLQYVPRMLTIVELGFIMSRGKLLSDMLAGAGMPASVQTDTQKLLQYSDTILTAVEGNPEKLEADLAVTFRRVVRTLNRSATAPAQGTSRRLRQGGGPAALDEPDLLEQILPRQDGAARSDRALSATGHRLLRHTCSPGSAEAGGGGECQRSEARPAPWVEGLEEAAIAAAAGPPLGRRLQATVTTTTTTATSTTSRTTSATGTGSRTTTSTTTQTTSTSTLFWDDSEGSCVDDPNVCEPDLIKSVMRGMRATGVKPHSAMGKFFTCLADHTSHLSLSVLLDPPANLSLAPPGHECDVLTGCEDTPDWQDSQNRTCYDYWNQWLCADPSADPAASSNCCVCGSKRMGCSDIPGWVDSQGRGCAMYNALGLCGTTNATVPGKDGRSASAACCACGGGLNYTNTTQTRVVDKYSRPTPWTDDWGRNCSWYVSNQVCTPSGDLGPGWNSSATWANQPAASQRNATLLPQTRGENAWSVCVGCGGGETVASNFVQETGALIQGMLPRTQYDRCGDGSSYIDSCPHGCGMCLLDKAPTPETITKLLLECHDDFAYRDWLNQDCTWYFFNDPEDNENGIAACSRYGDDATRSSCPRTCNTCNYARRILEVHDLDHSGTFNLDEFNLVLTIAGADSTVSRLFMKTQISIYCEFLAGHTDEACVKENFPEITVGLLINPQLWIYGLLRSAAPGLLADRDAPTGFLGLDSGTAASQRFTSPLILSGNRNLALQIEDASPDAFKECRTDDDCAGAMTSACGNLNIPANKICTRRYQVPMYCASGCWTGGCGKGAKVMPRATGQFCQPCDACFTEAKRVCPKWCDGYAVDAEGNYSAFTGVTTPVVPAQPQDPVPGSFTIAAWVRKFQTQWLFEKRIRIPGLNSSWAGYDKDTGMLVCWQIGATKVRFRNRWSDLALSEYANPLASQITSTPDEWHYVALWRNSYFDSTGRREDLRFMVDGQLSGPALTAWADPTWPVPSYGFPDCGGQQLSVTVATQNVWEGPRDFYTDQRFLEWSGLWPSGAQSAPFMTMPLATGTAGMVALTFENVGLPKNAVVKGAYLQICAGRTIADYLTEARFGTTANIQGTAHLKIAGLMVDPWDIKTPANISANPCFISNKSKGSARTSTEVSWDIDFNMWRERGVLQMPDNGIRPPAHQDCKVLSPDVTDMVLEMLQRLDAENATSQDLTFIITDKKKDWGQCGKTSILSDPAGFAAKSAEIRNFYDQMMLTNKIMTDTMPLWMIPIKDSRRKGASKAKLLIQYCLNEDCISPSFLGAGVGAVEEAAPKSFYERRLTEEAASGAEEEQDLPTGRNHVLAEAPEAAGMLKKILPDPDQDEATEGRRLGGASCSASTCTYVGSTLEPKLTSEGQLYNPLYISSAMPIALLQAQYYSGLAILKAAGEEELTGGEELVNRPNLDVPQYPSEVVSIIPPVMFQQRAQVVPCDKLAPALAESLTNYFTTQIAGKCNYTYTCPAPNGFVCLDRTQLLPEDERHFGAPATTIQDEPWYFEFLDLFTVPMVYRDQDFVQTSGWVDLQTSKVMLVNVFMTPSLRAGTLLTITWEYSGPGRFESQTDMRSFMNMSSDDRRHWTIMVGIAIAASCLDLLVLFITVFGRWRHRRRVLAELRNHLASNTKTGEPTDLTEKQEDAIMEGIPLLEGVECFDVALRIVNIAFCVWHRSMYPDPKEVVVRGETRLLEYFDEPIKSILDLQWSDPMMSNEDKVNYFMAQVLDLTDRLDKDKSHRLWASLLILLFFVRTVVFMRVHPRIAILYATITQMIEDFLHFLVLFCTIFGVLAFWGNWNFGDADDRFGDYPMSLYTQFHMLVGEFGMDDNGFALDFGIYCICFFFLMTALLLNFFLAIVIDAYTRVKDCVKECEVESSVLWDLITCIVYPVMGLLRGWPSRSSLIFGMMTADLDQDRINDENNGGKDVPVTASILCRHKLVKGEHRALSLLRYYRFVCPAVSFRRVEHKAEVYHKKLYRHLSMVDEVRNQVFGQVLLDLGDEAPDPLATLVEGFAELKSAQAKELQDIKEVLLSNMRTSVREQAFSDDFSSGAFTQTHEVRSQAASFSMGTVDFVDGARMAKVENTLQRLLDAIQHRDAQAMDREAEARRKAAERDALIVRLLQQSGSSANDDLGPSPRPQAQVPPASLGSPTAAVQWGSSQENAANKFVPKLRGTSPSRGRVPAEPS